MMGRRLFAPKSVIVGATLTLLTAATLIFLVLFTRQLYSKLVLINVIAFQLSFIWTCAELLDLANDNWTEEDDPTDGNFSR
jgi:hypothetical protein